MTNVDGKAADNPTGSEAAHTTPVWESLIATTHQTPRAMTVAQPHAPHRPPDSEALTCALPAGRVSLLTDCLSRASLLHPHQTVSFLLYNTYTTTFWNTTCLTLRPPGCPCLLDPETSGLTRRLHYRKR